MQPSRYFPQETDTQSRKKKPRLSEEQEHRTRLDRFLSGATRTTPKHTKDAREKLFQRLPSVIKYEQPQSIWQPGYEGSTSQSRDHPVEPSDASESKKDDEQDPPSPSRREKILSKPNANKRNTREKVPTQLELQWAEFKKQYPHLIILIQVGFKIQLFGSDAIIASRVLSIGHLAIPGRESAFFPKTSLHLHLSRLIMAGYKVGLVSQSETRSIKKFDSSSSNKLFKRHLSGIYSLSTWTENDPGSIARSTQANPSADSSPSQLLQNWIVSFYEPPSSDHPKTPPSHRKAQLNMAAICPQNGDIVWDSWVDDPMRSKLETRMLYFKPVEIVVPPSGLHPSSEKLLNWILNDMSNVSYASPRLESTGRDYTPQTAYELVTRFCQPLSKCRRGRADEPLDSSTEEKHTEPEFLHHIVELPDGVLIALAGLIMYMKSYQLESIFRQPSQFKSFSSQSYMILDANTLRNFGRWTVEIFENSTDRSERGSLFWVLDRTKTNMGKRLLKQWIGKPLVNFEMLKERADAIHELTMHQNHPVLIRMRKFLGTRLPDLEKSLVRIQYGKVRMLGFCMEKNQPLTKRLRHEKCTEKELLKFLETMDELTGTFGNVSSPSKPTFKSNFLNNIFLAFSEVREQTIEYRSELDAKAILKGEYHDMFTEADDKYPELIELKDCISCVEAELNAHLEVCRTTLQNPKLEYITIGADEMLVEVRIQHLDRVPEDWITMNSTRAVHRFRTPRAQTLLDERNKYRDQLKQTTSACFQGFLRSMEENYNDFRNSINKLALMDCLLSLAKAGIDNNYCRANLVHDHHERIIEVVAGRHPIVEQLIDDPLVSNNFCFKKHSAGDHLNSSASSTMILTGNNMGGKSVTAKMIACIVIMAQIGSYVPAQKAKLGLFDACYTRMGMSEDISQGRSAFMVEMSETCKILRNATQRSLVIFDELGYGTSTFDGLAIAAATLHHLVRHTVFITHYPQLNQLAIKYPNLVKSYHMKFIERPACAEGGTSTPEITFLYKLVVGLTEKSHGIHVAKLAGLPPSILRLASFKSDSLQDDVVRKKELHRASLIKKLLIGLSISSHRVDGLNHLDLALLAKMILDGV